MPTHDTPETVPAIVRALADQGYDDVLVLQPGDYARVLSERRRELVGAIHATDGLSVGELADHLGREQPAVSRDLDVLFRYDVVDYRRDGRRKLPVLAHDTVLAEPLV